MNNTPSMRNLRKKAEKLFKKNKLVEASQIYLAICKSTPDDTGSLLQLSLIYRKLNHLDKALIRARQAHAIKPENAKVIHTLATIYHKGGDYQSAIQLYKLATSKINCPNEVFYFLANAYREMDEIDYAEEYYEQHVQLEPTHMESINNLAAIYVTKGKLGKAFTLLEPAHKINPSNPFINNNLGRAYLQSGDASSAAELFLSIIKNGGNNDICSNYLMTLNYLSGTTAQFILDEHIKWASVYTNNADTPCNIALKNSESKISIGFVSPDFKDHPVARFIASFFKFHNSEKITIHCYSDTQSPDLISNELASLVPHWTNSFKMSDTDLCSTIRKDKINILVDLAGHTANNRLGAFACKPAPIQVTYIGYPNTTGLTAIDYRITDSICDPEALSDCYNTESLMRLPQCFLAYTPDNEDTLPSRQVADTSSIRFGSFNNLAKTTPDVIALWSKLLSSVSGSTITLKARATSEAIVKERYYSLFQQNGIDKNRVIFQDSVADKANHLNCYNEIDIALDTFPYNGTTTTCEALWMGVPVITLSGDTHVSRVGASLLHQLSLDHLIADNEDEYLNISSELATHPDTITTLHQTLRDRMKESALMNYKQHAEALEKTFYQMVQRQVSQQND